MVQMDVKGQHTLKFTAAFVLRIVILPFMGILPGINQQLEEHVEKIVEF